MDLEQIPHRRAEDAEVQKPWLRVEPHQDEPAAPGNISHIIAFLDKCDNKPNKCVDENDQDELLYELDGDSGSNKKSGLVHKMEQELKALATLEDEKDKKNSGD